MGRPSQVVKVYGVQDRRSTTQAKLPWVARYTIDGRHRSKSFRTRMEADRYRGSLLQSVQSGDRFDLVSGEPVSWQPALRDVGVHDWARRWLGEQWSEWQPRTRTSATEALARFITLAVEPAAKPPDGLRVYLYSALAPGSESARDDRLEKWMVRHCLTVGDLDRDRIAVIDRKLSVKLDGAPMAANTANRIRIVARACVQAAVEAGAVPVDVWPQRSKTRARRKVARTNRSVGVRALPGPAVMAAAIDAIVTHQPGSRAFRVMTAVAYYAGLRPSEVVMLRVRSTVLPNDGWGRLEVTEADISFDEPGEPKTGPRSVPIPPVLVAMLSEWTEHNHLTDPDRLLFRTRKRHPSERIELDPGLAPRPRLGRPTTAPRLRLPPRCSDHMATRRHAPRRNRTTPRTQRRNPRLHLRRRPRRRRTHRQPTRRHPPRIERSASPASAASAASEM